MLVGFKNYVETLALVVVSGVGFVSCSKAEMTSGQGRIKECKPSPEKPCNQIIGDALPEVFPFVPLSLGISPALAVRKSNCVLCHGTVNGDVITDFNVTMSPFESRKSSQDTTDNFFDEVIARFDGIRPQNWSTVNVLGKLVIPDATISGNFARAFSQTEVSIPLVNALKQEMITIPAAELNSYRGKIPVPVVGGSRDKTKPGIDDIRTLKRVFINPPTGEEIQKLLTMSAAKPIFSSSDLLVKGAGDGFVLNGFMVKKGLSGTSYLINQSSSVECHGDIVVGGTLVLKDIEQFKVGPLGCNLYVQNSVFIKGSLVASGSDDYGLQITSGRAIVAGIRYARAISGPVHEEIKNVGDDIEDTGFTYYLVTVNASGAVKRLATTQYSHWRFPGGPSEFSKISASHLTWLGSERPVAGAVCKLPDTTVTGTNNGQDCIFYTPTQAGDDQSATRKSVVFKGVLLAAPIVESRYFGSIKGAIVADFVLVSLNRLNFSADVRFDGKPAFPLLGRPILHLER
jgi:hypothetical protein